MNQYRCQSCGDTGIMPVGLPSGAPRFRTEDVRAFRESDHTQEETA